MIVFGLTIVDAPFNFGFSNILVSIKIHGTFLANKSVIKAFIISRTFERHILIMFVGLTD